MGWRTTANCANEDSGEIVLLGNVQRVWDLWGVRIVRPGLLLRVRHRSDECNKVRYLSEEGQNQGHRSQSSIEESEGGRRVINV